MILARRLAGHVGLLFTVVLLSGFAVSLGAALLARAVEQLRERRPPARYLAVARTALIDSVREDLVRMAGLRVIAERSVAEVLDDATQSPPRRQPVESGSPLAAHPLAGSERLSVIEFEADLSPPSGFGGRGEATTQGSSDPLDTMLDTLRATPGVTDVIDLNARARAQFAARRAGRRVPAGLGVIALGAVAFAFGVARTAQLAAAQCREELSTRLLLGANPRVVWTPLSLVFGLTTLIGVAATVGVMGALWSLGGPGAFAPLFHSAVVRHLSRLVVPALMLATVAVATAALSARRAVLEVTRHGTLVALITAIAIAAAPRPVAAGAVADPDWQVLRSVARQFADYRRLLHQLEREQWADVHRALHALASDDLAIRQLGLAALDMDALEVRRLRDACATLASRHLELREIHRANFAPGPPIEPRLPPVAEGHIIAGFHQPATSRHLRTYHRGIAIRTLAGETIRATAAGRIAFASELAGFGPVVVISHGQRTFSVYGKVAEPLVVRGMQVEPGEPIARAGSEEGLLFFAVRERGRALDPVVWLRFGSHSKQKARARSGAASKPPKLATGYGDPGFGSSAVGASCEECPQTAP